MQYGLRLLILPPNKLEKGNRKYIYTCNMNLDAGESHILLLWIT